MNPLCTGHDPVQALTRRNFLNRFGMGVAGMALSDLVASDPVLAAGTQMLPGGIRAPKAKRVIYLFQSGAPSQMDLFDYKPLLKKMQGEQLPDSVRMGQRLTGMSGNQASLPLVGCPWTFEQHGQSGAWVNSDLLPHTAKITDDLCFIKSMYTEAINHGPGVTFMQTGSQIPGRPSMGAWLDYGLGADNQNLPSFVVMVTKNKGGQPLVSRLWGSGFLPGQHQGVRFRADKNAVLYLANPSGVDSKSRSMMLERLKALHELEMQRIPDEAINTRIAQYEMAFRMQSSVPELTDMSKEPAHVLDQYGPDVRKPGTFAANCLLARRLAEKGVKFIQLYHPGWDHHGNLPGKLPGQCRETDQPSAALVRDLKQRGMLEDTLVIWGGEFGRTNYSQGKFNGKNFGRDHHPRCFTLWMAGGGVKPGTTFGRTDDYCYNLADAEGNPIQPTKHKYHPDAVHVHDLHATMLHLLGVDHTQLSYKHQGRRFRLTDAHGKVVKGLLA